MFGVEIEKVQLPKAQCESLRFKLIGGLAVRRACYGVLRRLGEGLLFVFCRVAIGSPCADSSWRMAPRVSRSSSAVSCAPSVPRWAMAMAFVFPDTRKKNISPCPVFH